MNHGIKKVKFASTRSQRNAIMRNAALDLINNKHIKLTTARAKLVKQFVDSLVSRSTDDMNSRRYIESTLGTNKANDQIIEIASKNNGTSAVQIFKLGARKGDGAELSKLIIKGHEIVLKSKLKKVKDEGSSTETAPKSSAKSSFTSAAKADKKRSQVSNVESKAKTKTRSGI